MSERIPDEVALTLTQLFYRNLSQGYPVDLCVSRVRQGLISAYGSHQLYWALPILYLQPEFDGFLSPKLSTATSVDLLDEYSSPLATNTTATYSGVLDDTEMSLPIEDMIPSGLIRDSSGMDWLGEETWGDLVDEIEYDDPSYAEDSAFVSDIFRQLDQQSIEEEEPVLSSEIGQSLQDSYLEQQIPAAPREDVSVFVPPTTNHPPQNLSQDLENFRLLASRNRQRRQRFQIMGIIGASAIAIVLIFSWLWQNRHTLTVRDVPAIPTPSLPIETPTPTSLREMSTGMVTATAIEKLNQGDLEAGLASVEELLDRNALQPAQAALQLVSPNQEKQGSINFLKGRLAWQSVQTGDKQYSIDDARRYWETAVKANPGSLTYINALGFAYYAEGNINRANDSWFQALSLALRQVNTVFSTEIPITSDVPAEALPAYAGLALGMYKSARGLSPVKQEQYINEAIKLRQTVLEKDPVNFQLDELKKNWLWTEEILQDWRSLLQQKSPKGR